MNKKFCSNVITLIILSIFVEGCSINAIVKELFNPLTYSENTTSLVINVNYKTWPDGYSPGQTCNLIPDLRIWGDGRYVKGEFSSGIRTIKTGTLSKDELDAVILRFDQSGFFKLKERYSINTAATGLNIEIHLLKKTFSYSYWNPDKSFIEIINSVQSKSEHIFQPDKAFLIIIPFNRPLPPDQIIPWPANAKFHLIDVKQDGMWVDGAELDLIWNSINNDTLQMPVFNDSGKDFVVALEIPGISIQDPPYPCW